MFIRSTALVAAAALITGCAAETFTSTGPTGLEVVHGPPPMVSLGTELDTLLAVRIVDEAGEPVSGVNVEWEVVEGDGDVMPISATSGPDGLTGARWKFRYLPGPQRVRVRVAGLEPLDLVTSAELFRAVQVTAGYHFGCGLDADQVPWCWGGDSLELGEPSVGRYSLRATPVSGGHRFEEVRAGSDFTCGRTGSGEVWCWGHNGGRVVSPANINGSPLPLQVVGVPLVSSIATGRDHACGIGTDSTTWCWGLNDAGQSGGVGTFVPPTQVATGLRFVALAAAATHTCGLLTTGAVHCWGSNASGQLGDSSGNRNAPTGPVQGGHSFVQIEAGDFGTCGRTAAGEIWCWGHDVGLAWGATPVLMPAPPALSFSLGFGYLAVLSVGGSLTFAASNDWAEFVPAIAAQGVSQISGRGSYCVITRTGGVYCSGSLVDQVFCSALPPNGCGAPQGPIPLPAGGRVYGYPPFGD